MPEPDKTDKAAAAGPPESMAGERAIVTGASRGIGLAIARRLAAEGCVVACLGRDASALDGTVAAIEKTGGKAVAVTGDLREEPDVSAQIEEAVGRLGGLDIVINNAGTDTDDWGDVHEWSVENYDEIMAVNTRAPFLVSKHAIPHLLESGGGCLLHVSSICAITVWPGDFAYGVSKAALNMLSDHIAVEYAIRGIRSNTIMPGAVRTDMFDNVVASLPDGKEWESGVIGRHPIARMGDPEEIASLAVKLCSSELGFMTGSNVAIDGGYSKL
jgi:A-factor type gamma-butyrolactone 1'-reductase (1S-forming)